MIFLDQIKEKDEIVNRICDSLFDIALQNQVHASELLIVALNGAYTNKVYYYDGIKTNPHTIGPDRIGFSNNDNAEFIKKYVTANALREPNKAKHHKNMVELKNNNKAYYNEMIDLEKQSIQIEFLIYLKISGVSPKKSNRE